MAFRSVWWHDPLEYGAGLNPPRTWPNVMEQYTRPHALYDLRYKDIPTEQYTCKLYYEHPRMGQPVYRGKFRDKPHTVTSYYPSGIEKRPPGFYGRQYFEDGPPQFKYQGPQKDSLYWLERPSLQPVFPRPQSGTAPRKNEEYKVERVAPRYPPQTLSTGSSRIASAYSRASQSLAAGNPPYATQFNTHPMNT